MKKLKAPLIFTGVLGTIMTAAYLFLAPNTVQSQGTAAPMACPQFFAANGTPLAGGMLGTFRSGTLIPQATFTDATLSTPNPTPVILDAGGYPTNPSGGCGLFLDPTLTYTFTLRSAQSVQQWSVDGITINNFSSLLTQPNTWTALQTFAGGVVIPGGSTFTSITAPNINNIITVDGINVNNLQEAYNACHSTSCVIDMRGGLGSHDLGSFDPGEGSAVTIQLGPYTYTANQITLRAGIKIVGSSMSFSGSIPKGTNIQSTGSDVTPLFVIPQSNNQPASHTVLEDFNIIGAVGNLSQDGVFMDCSTTSNAGLWYAVWKNIQASKFGGSAFHFKGQPIAGAVNQFNTFNNLVAFRTVGGGPALKIESGNGQFDFIGGEFDGQSGDMNGTNVFIGTTTSLDPYNISFYGTTIQNGDIGVQLSGVESVHFHSPHMENLHGGFNVHGAGSGNLGIDIDGGLYFLVGINSGNGYILSNDFGGTTSIIFKDNWTGNTPDKWIISTQQASVMTSNNTGGNTPFTSSNITTQMAPAATMDIQHYGTVWLNAAGTAITTLKGYHAPGEMISFFCIAPGPCTFSSGGNLILGANSSLVMRANDSAQFVWNDLNNVWVLVSTTVYTVASGTASLGTALLATGVCATSVTVSAPAVLATDVISWSMNNGGVTGYTSATGSGLVIYAIPSSGNVNFFVCNPTAGNITPQAATVNWKVIR